MESYIIEENMKKSSRLPARLDLAQSGTGLILGLFMWVHMLLVCSIILGKGSFDFVAKTMELAFLSDTGHGYPIAVFFAVLGVFTLFIVHALLGVRKFPISWKQHRIIRDQMQMMNHTDTNLWYIQVVTAFIMFFAGSIHLYTMLTNPGGIGPYSSADRVISSHFWLLYLVLLPAVELHGTIGLYRLCMKWGWFQGKDARASRKKMKVLKNRLTIFFLSIGALALLVFIVIGIGHRGNVGERYHGTAYQASGAVEEEAAAPAKEAEAPGAAEEEAAAPVEEETHAVKATEPAAEQAAEPAPAVEQEAAHAEEAAPAEDHAVEASHEAESEHAAEPAHGDDGHADKAGHGGTEAHDGAHADTETHKD